MELKKKISTLLLILSSSAAVALPVGNLEESSLLCSSVFFCNSCDTFEFCGPCNEGWFAMRGGYYGDFVFNRYLESAGERQRNAEIASIQTNAGYLALNFCSRVDVFTTLGVSCLEIDLNSKLLTPVTAGPLQVVINTKADFSWSVGARATLIDCRCLTWGIEGQYFQYYPENVKSVTVGKVYSNTDNLNIDLKYYEWQIGTGVSYHLSSFVVPYAAVKYARAKIDTNPIAFTVPPGAEIFTIPNFKSRRSIGVALGVSIIGCDFAALTVEGRFIDENALYINAQLRF